jgi:hypothetical protein
MTVHEMTLVLDRPDVINDADGDALYGAFGDDLLGYSSSNGRVYVTVERTSATLHEAVSSALSTLATALPSARVVVVEIDHERMPVSA